jgi:hypothetical protein
MAGSDRTPGGASPLSRRDFVGLMAGAASLTSARDRLTAGLQPSDDPLAVATRPDREDGSELVTLDAEGIVRWRSDGREVALYGANYCLPSASDYRAAGYVGANRKRLIEQDMAHFARMGWDALRLSFWGDWENCDRQGNLIANDHLDLLDYLVAQAAARGIYMLLSPIVTYSSLWPDLQDDPAVVGFSRYYDRSKLGTDPDAIAAQVNYLQQLLRHVNPYTGRALKAEPNILFIEMINEPWHHSSDFDGSVRYIDALTDAVRSTGCNKLTLHNISQDFGMARAIQASKAQGASFGWYPSGLDMRGALRGNWLRALDEYPHPPLPELDHKAKAVYEFDLPDVMSGYHYPAMARAFRGLGAQFAAMFSYDMLTTAPYNLGWQVHCLNMVYTPQKAVSAIIAGEAMRTLPRLGAYGPYPQNARFGDFRVSYEANLSELNAPDRFMYSNDTATRPIAPASLRRIVGYGSSPVVQYEGKGLYFLDKIADGVWRLEVYPDAIQVADPFAAPRLGHTAFRLVARRWPMRIRLPDLGPAFRLTPLNTGNTYAATAQNGHLLVAPGVFLLMASHASSLPASLPERVGRIGLREWVCPSAPAGSPDLLATAREEYLADRPLNFEIAVVGEEAPHAVFLHLRPAGHLETRVFAMRPAGGYTYRASLPSHTLPLGTLEYWFRIETGTGALRYPPAPASSADPSHPSALLAALVAPDAPLTLFLPERDAHRLDLSRAIAGPPALERSANGSADGASAYRLRWPARGAGRPGDVTASLYIGDRIEARGDTLRHGQALAVIAWAGTAETILHVTLVEKDGTAWSSPLKITTERNTYRLPFTDLKPARWALVPQGFPGDGVYWADSTRRSSRIDLRNVERLQLSLRKEDLSTSANSTIAVDIERVTLLM